MCRKFILVWILLSLLAGSSLAVIDKTQQDIISLIKNRKFDLAKSSIDKLISDAPQDAGLPEALCWFAEQYGYSDDYENAKKLYSQIILKWPNNPFANKAKLGYAIAEVRTFIASQDFEQAKGAVNDMLTDFNDNPDFPNTLYFIAQSYEWSQRYSDAKETFKLIIDKYPRSYVAQKASLGIYRMDISSIIVSGQVKIAEADIIAKIKEDFNDNPELPETLRLIANRYESVDRYAEAAVLYQQIIENWPNSQSAAKVKINIPGTKIKSLIVPVPPWSPQGRLQDYNDSNSFEDAVAKADDLMEQFINDFNGNPDLPNTLYWIARRYGYSGRFEEEKEIYKMIIENYPQCLYLERAKIDLAGAEILSYVLSDANNDPDISEKMLGKFAADFNDNSYFSKAMLFMADKCHEYGTIRDRRVEIAGKPRLEKPFSFAANMLEKYVLGTVQGTDDKADAYRMACEDYYRLGDGKKTTEYAEMTLQTDSNHRFAANMLWLAATGYERMRDNEQLSAYDADVIIEGTYQELMDKYPGNKISDWSALHLGRENYKKGNNVKACAYFSWFLMNASPELKEDKMRMAAIESMMEGCGGAKQLQASGQANLPQGGK